MSTVKVGDIERAIAAAFPVERAEDWDRCGLLAGDPDAAVTGVTLALDATRSTVAAAVAHGSNVLVTHHPVFLTPPQWITPGRGPSGVLFDAMSQGVALINAHTNLDRDTRAQALIPRRLGLEPVKPLERSLQSVAVVTVFCPVEAAEGVVDAMAGAGAGRIGDYERCWFAGGGTGEFTAPERSSPAVGEAGSRTKADEVRVEMVCPSSSATGVVAAAVAAHPYEEPLVHVTGAAIARNAARLGMVSAAPEGTTLESLVDRCTAAFGVTARVWGDPVAEVDRVATATGSAGSLVGDALSGRCQALVAGEVRYHDALNAVEAGLAVIELGHDATEWPLVGLLENEVRSIAGLAPESVHALAAEVRWWSHS